jgi:hypothetical protein
LPSSKCQKGQHAIQSSRFLTRLLTKTKNMFDRGNI